MTLKPINSPHDRFFKSAMKDVRIAREFIACYLPNHVREVINLDSLILCPNSYVNNELALSASDVLYKAIVAGEEAYVYLLCEHQSTVDALMAFRVWQYIVAIWAEHLKESGSKKLPLVIPLVFYHGEQAYTASQDIRDLIQAPASLIENVLFQPFTLIDTHQLSDEKLREQHWAGIMTFVMKHIYARDVLMPLQQILAHLRQFEQEGGRDFVVTLLKYLLIAGETAQAEQVVELIKNQLSQPVGEQIMTIAEQLRQQGVQQGMQQGMQKGMQQGIEEGMQQGIQQGMQQGMQQGEVAVLMRLLQHKFGPLPNHYRQRLINADASALLRWTDQLFEVDSLELLFSDLSKSQ